MNFRYRLMQFMSGRYGMDEMNYGLFGLAVVIAVFNISVRWFSPKAWAMVQLLVYALIAYAVFRALSRNITARQKENRFFTKKLYFFKNRFEIYRARKNDLLHVYKRCPSCKAVLRLPRRIGKHTTVCPRCGKEFEVTVKK